LSVIVMMWRFDCQSLQRCGYLFVSHCKDVDIYLSVIVMMWRFVRQSL